jgi:hypothetical protein
LKPWPRNVSEPRPRQPEVKVANRPHDVLIRALEDVEQMDEVIVVARWRDRCIYVYLSDMSPREATFMDAYFHHWLVDRIHRLTRGEEARGDGQKEA